MKKRFEDLRGWATDFVLVCVSCALAFCALQSCGSALACPEPMNATPMQREGVDGFWVSASGLKCMSAEVEQRRVQVHALQAVQVMQDARIKRLDAYLASDQAALDSARDALKKARGALEPSVTESPVLWFALGIGASAAAAITIKAVK